MLSDKGINMHANKWKRTIGLQHMFDITTREGTSVDIVLYIYYDIQYGL